MGRAELVALVSNLLTKAVEDSTSEMRNLAAQLRGQRPVITTGEARAYFDYKVTERTIRLYIKQGKLKAFKQGKQWFIRVEDIYAFQTTETVQLNEEG